MHAWIIPFPKTHGFFSIHFLAAVSVKLASVLLGFTLGGLPPLRATKIPSEECACVWRGFVCFFFVFHLA